ncbi:MBL fold metallo-hydrolase [Tardiphaga alba]|uniref:MBL fold metallo-hydrolase n=1 Tax=Tardiphaga alba TaxID=340268 RepID=A0ABX8A781_9BRAD|nr:MBL fold metallo-hydrolase [Tardiphaga alba]QUS38539.1 MBL fold metallo-hydrolase [Tardiphaga alba]
MATKFVVNVDLVDIWQEKDRKKLIRTLAWGDEISVVKQTRDYAEIEAVDFVEQDDGSILPEKTIAYIQPSKTSGLKLADVIIPRRQNKVLKVNFVDVQQGDGSVIESPQGKVMLVDGGDNQLFARYLASRFRGTSLSRPKEIECILVTHGDADHFLGLPEIFKSEENKTPRKRLFMQPKRVYHNGIVKRPEKKGSKNRPEAAMLGPTRKVGKDLFLTGLETNLLKVDDDEMNAPFKTWKNALATYNKRAKVEFRRLAIGDNDAFDFFNEEDIKVEVLGPLTTEVGGKPALKFLGKPPRGPRIGHESLDVDDLKTSGLSASHTINGHSIVFRMTYGRISYLFSGDLNDEAGRYLTREHNGGNINLKAEVFKVPHHGSADFSGAFIQAVAPVVSIISSGDENARKEYIHPRATLVGALGKWSRVPEPLVLVTELVAFFNVEGWSRVTDKTKDKKRGEFFGFSRTAFGMVKTRTDGDRLLVYTDSGNLKMKEAYAYKLDQAGLLQPDEVVRA